MVHRDEILRELGLTPVWRRRALVAAEPVPATWVSDEPVDHPTPTAAIAPIDRLARIDTLDWTSFAPDVAACRACGLCQTRKQSVPGVGDIHADWLFVYIANVLKCRPPGNRAPERNEVESCRPYLDRQIALIQPKLIVALGKSAATTLLNVDATIASLRGRIHRYHGVALIVTYHPAYLLRNLPDKAKAWEDLCLARATVRKLQAEHDLQSASPTPSW